MAQNDKVVKVLSQSTLLQAIVSQLNIVDEQQDHARFAELARTVEAAGVGTYPAVTVDEQTSAFDAFSLLEAKKLGGVGVLNATGTLVGNISIQDFKVCCQLVCCFWSYAFVNTFAMWLFI